MNVDLACLGFDISQVHVSQSLGQDLALIDQMLGTVVAQQHGEAIVHLARELYRDAGDPKSLHHVIVYAHLHPADNDC